MPWVLIKTGFIAADGQEAVLREYLCDAPGCSDTAEHVVGAIPGLGWVRALCRAHAGQARHGQADSPRP